MRTLLKLLVLVVVAGVGLAATVVAFVPPTQELFGAAEAEVQEIDLNPLAQRSYLYASDGSVLAVLHAEENRQDVPLEDVPQVVIDTILAVEDEAFYEHAGVNLRATVRALIANVRAGDIEQGGSTITQQLVKNALLTPEQDADRKVKEAVLALELEKELSKDEILERYLNTVYFGNGAYGVQAASEVYFGVDVGELTVPQAALLAGLIRNPVGYDPVQNPVDATERRSEVLDRLVDLGHITRREADFYDTAPIPEVVQEYLPPPDDYFVEEVKQQLLDDPRLGATPQERYNAVFKGGLQVYTTFDSRLQAAAEEARNSTLPPDAWLFTAALAAVEPGSGAVRAMVGGPGFDRFKFNLATQGLRQTGSSFKTFALIAALEHGAIPEDTIDGSSPCSFEIPGEEDYVVESRGGSGTLRRMTESSINCAFVNLGLAVGLDNVIDTARRLGVSSPLEPVLSLPLGTMLVSPLEMASAYGTIAADGMRNAPYLIERVETADGDVVFEHRPDAQRVLDEDVARLTTDVLEGVVTSGTGTAAALPDREVAGKTGTTDDNADAWFVGYTPQLATAVWVGAPGGRLSMSNLGGIRVYGGDYPAEIFQKFMAVAMEGKEPVPFPDPPELDRAASAIFVPDDECREEREANLDPTKLEELEREGELAEGAPRVDDIARGDRSEWCAGNAREGRGEPVTTTSGSGRSSSGGGGSRPATTAPPAEDGGGSSTTAAPGDDASGTTAPPTTAPPATAPPTTAPPVTAPPTTAPPVTAPPTTAPPAPPLVP